MKPWEDSRTPWKTKASFMSYLRGALRKAWNTHPCKLSVIKNSRRQIPNPNPRGNKKTVWGFDCPLCGTTDVIDNAQVDHKKPAGALSEISDIQGFAERLLVVTEDDLRLICKGCNSALSYSEKQGVSFEEARATKEAIAIQKAKEDNQWLRARNIEPGRNAKARRQQIIDVLLAEQK